MANQAEALTVQVRPTTTPWTDRKAVTALYNGKEIVALQFGPSSYSNNVAQMRGLETKQYGAIRPATTAESIAIASNGFGQGGEVDAKRDIFNPRWLQDGRIARWDDGVYVNIVQALRDGNVDERILRQLRDKAKPIGPRKEKVRFGENDFVFVPYEAFVQGVQEAGKFAEGGLARGLEYAEGDVAPCLKGMASTCKNGVNVVYFDSSKTPLSGVVELDSDEDSFRVDGDNWDDGDGGYAFGVLNGEARSAEATPKK